MRIGGRRLGDYVRNLPRIAALARYTGRACRQFRDPGRFLYYYFHKDCPPERRLELRSGLTLHLSDCRDDITTAFTIFTKGTYGAIAPGSTVVDVGANIGAFALYAAQQGAARVLAFEAGRDAYAVLERNVRANGLDGVITPIRAAVTGRDGDTVMFPASSSIFHAIGGSNGSGELEPVTTVTLARALADHDLAAVDLVKLNCEGAEYDILYNAGDELFARVRSFAVEYHRGGEAELVAYMEGKGQRLQRRERWGGQLGNLYFSRPPAAR